MPEGCAVTDTTQIKGKDKGRRVRWRAFTNSMVSNKLVQAFRGCQLQKVIQKNQQQIQERIKSVTLRASARVNRVTHWVFKLSFAKLVIPLLLIGFLKILSPHTEIQLGVLGGFFVFAFAFFFATKNSRKDARHSVTHSSYFELEDRVTDEKKVLSEAEKTVLPSQPQPLFHKLYILIPLNLISRLWGIFASTRLPPPFDMISVYLYCTVFRCNRDEAEFELFEYKTITEFFTRRLKAACRPLSPCPMVNPCDGTLTFSGPVTEGALHQVKGVTYNLSAFLGSLHTVKDENRLQTLMQEQVEYYSPDHLEDQALGSYDQQLSPGVSLLHDEDMDLHDIASSLLYSPAINKLHQVVIYLGPQDYHRFHSPVSWSVVERRHFPGQLLSVSPGVVAKVPGLFHTNERVAFLGHWCSGFFAMVAVGATNVGSIVMSKDPTIRTNRGSSGAPDIRVYKEPLKFEKGEEFGHFKFGSTIVLLFEAPRSFNFARHQENPFQIRMGEAL